MVRRTFPEIELIESETNLGYGTAANRAMETCSAQYVVLTNSDVMFGPNAIALLSDYLHRNPRVALAGPRLRNRDGGLQPSCFPLPGSPAWLLQNRHICRLIRHVPRVGGRFLLAWDHAEERQVPWLKGAVLAVRRSAFRELGGFNESFFMYYEEVDLCVRLARRGWEIRFTPVAEVTHVGGASTARVSSMMALEFFISSMRFATIHYSRRYCALLRQCWNAVMAMRLARGYLRLLCCRETEARERIRQDLQAWKKALRYRISDPAPRPPSSARADALQPGQ